MATRFRLSSAASRFRMSPRRRVGADSSHVAQPAPQHTPEADEAGKIQKDNRVTRFQTEVERPSVVAIHDPGVALDELSNFRPPLFWRRRLPPGPPVERVEVDQGKPGALGKPSRHRGLPGSTGTDYQNAAQYIFCLEA